MSKVLCSIATRGRYFTTLPLVIQAVFNQTKLPDKLIIFDDNDEPIDVRKEFLYQHLIYVLNSKKIEWEWLFAGKKGQHHIHQMANTIASKTGYEWVWRLDDDAIPEPNVLENLYKHINPSVGAVAGTVFNPQSPIVALNSSGKIDDLEKEPNIQWGLIEKPKEVEHLYSTFLYRAGAHDFNLGLSRVAHREETLFSFGLYQKGYKLLVVPNAVSWHLKNPQGGIRDGSKEGMFAHDEFIFSNFVRFRNHTIVVLNSGLGDHIVFSRVLRDIANPLVFTCYPEIVPGQSIAEAHYLFGDIEPWNIYAKMDQWKWTDSLENAYRKLYL